MGKSNDNVLQVIQLTKLFRDFWGRESVKALDGLDFDVKRGEVFGLLGPNGSGKTTTVRLILGLLFPTSGAVRMFGASPREVDVKKRIGYMPEESHLYRYLNAEETLDFFGRLFRLPGPERRRRIDALIDMVGLKRARYRPIGQYSKGMARRIGLAQALINDPDLLILDEPTTGLDPIGTREMKDLILTLRERGKTILICSHLLADVEEICDRVCILYGGKPRAMGAVSDLLVTRELTQIRSPHLDEATVARVLSVIHEATGAGSPVEVSAPSRRLEDYFLGVVEAAQRERLVTAGAERGTGMADFLGEGAEDGQKLLDDLVAAGADAHRAMVEPVAQPQAAIDVELDAELIGNLIRGATAEPAGGLSPEAPAAAVAPEVVVRQDLLDDLIVRPTEDEEGDDKKAH